MISKLDVISDIRSTRLMPKEDLQMLVQQSDGTRFNLDSIQVFDRIANFEMR